MTRAPRPTPPPAVPMPERRLALAWVLLVWGFAGGVLLWGSGLDQLLQNWLFATYDQTFNTAMRLLGSLALGRTLALVALAIGIWLALAGGRAGSRAQFTVRVWRLVWGVPQQLWLWAQARASLAPAWQAVPRQSQAWLLVAPTLAVSGLAQLMIKFLVGRPRPKAVFWEGASAYLPMPLWAQDFWNGAPYNVHYMSFPSGHSCSVFAVATLLAVAYPRAVWLIWPLATVTACARFLAFTPHYAGDVLAGAALGAALGLLVAAKMKIGPVGARQEPAHG